MTADDTPAPPVKQLPEGSEIICRGDVPLAETGTAVPAAAGADFTPGAPAPDSGGVAVKDTSNLNDSKHGYELSAPDFGGDGIGVKGAAEPVIEDRACRGAGQDLVFNVFIVSLELGNLLPVFIEYHHHITSCPDNRFNHCIPPGMEFLRLISS